MMSPADYVNVVVLPTVREHFLRKTDQRLGMLACIATFHMSDHVARAEGDPNAGRVCERLRTRCEAQFDIVQGICHGTKHGETKPKLAHQHRAGEAIVAPGFAWNDPERGWGRGAWGGTSLAVEHRGRRYTYGQCIVAVLRAFGELYPNHLPDDLLGHKAVKALYPHRPLGIQSFSDVVRVRRRRRTLVWRAAKK